MIRWVRSVLGLEPLPVKRIALGTHTALDLKASRYYQHSANRLKLLQTLCQQYHGTPHEPKLSAVYEKTKNIHTALIGQQKATELELFHLQNTDHFINTFALIKAAHQKTKATEPEPAAVPPSFPSAGAAIQGFSGNPAQAITALQPARLQIPAIALDTLAPVSYDRLGPAGDTSTHEIRFTSGHQEKEYFLATVATRVGVYKPDLTYLGNTQITGPDNPDAPPSYQPVINWRGNIYVVNLNDYRLFPVKINRNYR